MFIGSFVVLPVLALALMGPVIAGAYLAVRLNHRGA